MPDAANLPRRTPVICGPTAGGKSDLALDLAQACTERLGLDAEIVTADAFQIYRGMDIGTAKPPAHERRGLHHHLLDVVDPSLSAAARFTVDDWLARARRTIEELRARGCLPIVVGGTHLYIKALLDGLFDGPEPDPALREALALLPADQRRAELERVDPAAAARIHPNDHRRTIRALEVFRLTGVPISTHQRQWDHGQPNDEFQLVILDWPADALNRRINARVKVMMELGLLEEVRALISEDRLGPSAREALGYKQLEPVVRRALMSASWPPPPDQIEAAVELIKIETRRFAKNQRTWLRRLGTSPGALRIDAANTPRDTWVPTILALLSETP